MPDFTQNQLRAITGFCLIVIALYYIYSKAENNNLEIIMIALTGSLVGFSILPTNKN